MLAQRDAAMAKHPKTTFIGAHFGALATDLPRVGALLDRLPNFFLDTSARIRDLGRQPYSARRFFIRYQDRILFGTDGPPAPSKQRMYYRVFETEDECFQQSHGPVHFLYGLNLPDETLKMLYRDNAKRILKI
ncbi:MAG: Amidohydrolase [candidate division BRC1 bacterium ADurb.BinA364]|nr:MAG: Amidohydrolase [candidate division BRC1 bacterium ADurb.BinA364]